MKLRTSQPRPRFISRKIYREFRHRTCWIRSVLSGLSEAEKVDYELVIEEEAFPFEEQAIDVHEENFELLDGRHLQPVGAEESRQAGGTDARDATRKNEISGGFVGSIDSYAYRMPIASARNRCRRGEDDVATRNPATKTTPESAATRPRGCQRLRR